MQQESHEPGPWPSSRWPSVVVIALPAVVGLVLVVAQPDRSGIGFGLLLFALTLLTGRTFRSLMLALGALILVEVVTLVVLTTIPPPPPPQLHGVEKLMARLFDGLGEAVASAVVTLALVYTTVIGAVGILVGHLLRPRAKPVHKPAET